MNGKTLLEVSEKSIFNDFAELTLSLKAPFAAFSQIVSIFSRKSSPKWRFYVIKVLCDIISHSVAVATAYKASAYQAVVLSCITVEVAHIERGLSVFFKRRTKKDLMCINVWLTSANKVNNMNTYPVSSFSPKRLSTVS